MTSIVIAPDSYKGSLNAQDVARAMAIGVRRVLPEALIRLVPMADGGEGTIGAVLAACGGELAAAVVSDALLQPKQCRFALIQDEMQPAAVLEVAQIVGLPDAAGRVEQRSSFGVGQLVRHCLDLGIRKFLIGLGGSSTNDGGIGVLAALGVGVLDAKGGPLPPTLAGLETLARLEFSGLDARLAACEISLLADVENPLCGQNGATAIFGPQKGVAADRLPIFDEWMRRYAALGDRWAGAAHSGKRGAGAAGGIGYALQLLGAAAGSGADMICRLSDIDAAISEAEWVLTGEGRTDRQTLLGKAPFEIACRANRCGVPATLVSGSVCGADLAAIGCHFSGCFSILAEPITLEAAMTDAERLIADAVEQATRLRFIY